MVLLFVLPVPTCIYYGDFIDLMVPVARGLILSVIIWNTIRSWFLRIRRTPSIRCLFHHYKLLSIRAQFTILSAVMVIVFKIV